MVEKNQDVVSISLKPEAVPGASDKHRNTSTKTQIRKLTEEAGCGQQCLKPVAVVVGVQHQTPRLWKGSSVA